MAMSAEFENFCKKQREAVEIELEAIFDMQPGTEVNRAAKYATLGGGHRWRALLAIACFRHLEGRVPPTAALRVGCAMELFHSASLILDDLPSMDDGKLRRGKECVHLVYPRWAVDMASTYLITIGYHVLLTLPGVEPGLRSNVTRKAAETALAMCRGQEADLLCGSNGESQLLTSALERHREKTGVLFGLAAASPAILAGVDSSGFEEFGVNVGLAYQMSDDLADLTETADRLGKTCLQDANRATPLEILGPARAEELRASLVARANDVLVSLGASSGFLRHFTNGALEVIMNRSNQP